MRALDFRISLSQVESGAVPEGELGFVQLMTATAIGVDRSTGEPRESWHKTLSWNPFPRFTIDVAAGSEADHRLPGCVGLPLRRSESAQVPATNVESLDGV